MDPKKNHSGAIASDLTEIVLVVDASSFTSNGFIGVTEYEGGEVEAAFDDAGQGLSLPTGMASRLQVRKGSRVVLAIDEGSGQTVELVVAEVGRVLRISDSRAYYAVGREGGGVIRLRNARATPKARPRRSREVRTSASSHRP